AALERPAPQRRRFETDKQRKQKLDDEFHAGRCSGQIQADAENSIDDDVEHEHQPQAVQQQPQRREYKSPEIESVAHEHEAFRVGNAFALAQRRFVNGVSGHLSSLHPPPCGEGRLPSTRGASGVGVLVMKRRSSKIVLTPTRLRPSVARRPPHKGGGQTTRPASLWWTALRPWRADRSPPRPAAPVPEP